MQSPVGGPSLLVVLFAGPQEDPLGIATAERSGWVGSGGESVTFGRHISGRRSATVGVRVIPIANDGFTHKRRPATSVLCSLTASTGRPASVGTKERAASLRLISWITSQPVPATRSTASGR
jgi:hypothetical protein